MHEVCFYLDSKYRDLWTHLVQAFSVPLVHEVDCPKEEVTDMWLSVDSPDDIVGERAFFSPIDAKYSPGTESFSGVALAGDVTLVFGSDDVHNTFNLRAGEKIYYVDTPAQASLHAVQAAALVLQGIWGA